MLFSWLKQGGKCAGLANKRALGQGEGGEEGGPSAAPGVSLIGCSQVEDQMQQQKRKGIEQQRICRQH